MPVIRNAHIYLTEGITWTLHANHVPIKARLQPACVFDAGGSRMTPVADGLDARAFLAILNSDIASFILKKFIKHNQDIEINDLRALPVVLPSRECASRLRRLATLATAAKRAQFAGAIPDNETALAVRQLGGDLQSAAPAYLRPSAQAILLETPADCLDVVELAVNWEVEKLYDVEGLGPFDDF